ncbi:MAG: hypothetical protein JWO54_662 [Candidatus Saccharibacteria bacterium]|nr:hypothetical protein [Candidatus Saccharibacteria bacterium]MDB5180900.1 hypothetical protein [Candidatus Saccharibacteria bacterium]
MNNETPEFFSATSGIESLNGNLTTALEVLEQLKNQYNYDDIDVYDFNQKDWSAYQIQNHLNIALAERAILPIGERIDMSGEISAIRDEPIAGLLMGYRIGKVISHRHLEGRLKSVDVVTLPTQVMYDTMERDRRYSKEFPDFTQLGLAFSLDEIAVIEPSKPVDQVLFGEVAEGVFPVQYPGLILSTAMPREEVIAKYRPLAE